MEEQETDLHAKMAISGVRGISTLDYGRSLGGKFAEPPKPVRAAAAAAAACRADWRRAPPATADLPAVPVGG